MPDSFTNEVMEAQAKELESTKAELQQLRDLLMGMKLDGVVIDNVTIDAYVRPVDRLRFFLMAVQLCRDEAVLRTSVVSGFKQLEQSYRDQSKADLERHGIEAKEWFRYTHALPNIQEPWPEDDHLACTIIVAALIEQGVIAWHGDGVSAISRVIRSYSKALVWYKEQLKQAEALEEELRDRMDPHNDPGPR